jgi:hypothetical protein
MRYGLLPAIFFVFGFQAGDVCAQERSSETAALSAWIEQIRPELEKTLGYSLPKLPLLESASLARQADPDVAACVKWRWPHLKNDALDRAIRDANAVSDSAALTRLVDGTNVILIRSENQRSITGWDRELANSPDLLKLTLIHETVRYGLDTRYDLVKLRSACQDAEEWFTLHALIEGRAQWVTRQMARKFAMEESFHLLAERYLHVPDQDPDPALRTISQSVVHKEHWAYAKGLAFFEYLEGQGITNEKQVFNNPPKLVKWIDEPELYVRALTSKRPDLASILAKLEKVPPPGNWTSTEQAWSTEMITQVGGVMEDQELLRKIADSYPEGRTLIWSDKTNLGRHIALTITRFPNEASARFYFGFAQKVIQTLDVKQGAKSTTQPVRLPGIKEAVEIDRSVQPLDQPGFKEASARVHFQTRVLLARCGDSVIDITWYNESGHTAWAERIIALVLANDK